jgi:Fe-Mn family superoxide dismutase
MFNVPQLPYDYESLEPAISREIMHLHHDKHHQTYVDKLNAAVEATPELSGRSIEEMLSNLDTIPQSARLAVRNNGGGHYNHSFFWQCLSPNGGGEPSGLLSDKLVGQYGSFQEFVNLFSEKALGVFGSGWIWLMPDMSIVTSPNQDTPVMQGLSEPILGLDVWEHAYYLDYKNVRADYVKAWWDVVNWEYVAERL